LRKHRFFLPILLSVFLLSIPDAKASEWEWPNVWEWAIEAYNTYVSFTDSLYCDQIAYDSLTANEWWFWYNATLQGDPISMLGLSPQNANITVEALGDKQLKFSASAPPDTVTVTRVYCEYGLPKHITIGNQVFINPVSEAEFNSATSDCWYWDEANQVAYIKAVAHSSVPIEVDWILKHIGGYDVHVPASWITNRLDQVAVNITNPSSYNYTSLYVDVVWFKDGVLVKYENFTFPNVQAGTSEISELTVTPPTYEGTYTVQVIGWHKGSRINLFTYEVTVTVSPGSGQSTTPPTTIAPTLPPEEEETPPPQVIIRPPIPWQVPLGIVAVTFVFYFFAATRKPSMKKSFRRKKKRKRLKPEDFRRGEE